MRRFLTVVHLVFPIVVGVSVISVSKMSVCGSFKIDPEKLRLNDLKKAYEIVEENPIKSVTKGELVEYMESKGFEMHVVIEKVGDENAKGQCDQCVVTKRKREKGV